MDPVSGFALAVNVIALVDFVAKLIANSNEVYSSVDGGTAEISELRAVTDELIQLNNDVGKTIRARREELSELTESELRQERLGLRCQKVAAELIGVLDKLKVEGSHARWNSIRHAILTLWNKDKIENLEQRLDRCRQELVATTLSSLRYLSCRPIFSSAGVNSSLDAKSLLRRRFNS
jgi:hypothetical protein